MSKSELQQACEDAGVMISSKHLYVDYSDCGSDKFPCDKWACTIHYGEKSETFTYFTGSGHRKLASGIKREGMRKYVSSNNVAFGEKEAIEKGYLVLKRYNGKIVGPEVADVLYCILSDADACETTFDDWCSNVGANNDSLKDLNTYLACQRNGTKLIRLLGRDLFNRLRSKEH
jgi:hypothetical protein